MFPLTYDQAEFLVILIYGPVMSLFCFVLNFIGERWGLMGRVVLAYDGAKLILTPLWIAMYWSLRERPSPFAEFAPWYFSLCDQILK